jgi:hypothetical protein
MTIDPRIGFWFSIVLAAIGALAGLSTQLTTIFGIHTADIILATAFVLMTIGNAVNAILHAIPSKVSELAKSFYLGSGHPVQ